jgi:uncharacterized protein (DUF58 family)
MDPGDAFVVSEEVTIMPGQTAKIDLVARRRGVFELDTFAATTSYPLGMWRARIRTDARGQIIVWPSTIQSELPATVAVMQTSHVAETGASRSGEEDYIGLRSYRRGDPLRLVHWQQTARHDRLIVRQRSGSTRRVASITLDTRAGIHADHPEHFEHCVSVVAWLIESALMQGISVTVKIGLEKLLVRHYEDLPAAMDRLAAASMSDVNLPQASGLLVTTVAGASTAGREWTIVCVDDQFAPVRRSGAAA